MKSQLPLRERLRLPLLVNACLHGAFYLVADVLRETKEVAEGEFILLIHSFFDKSAL